MNFLPLLIVLAGLVAWFLGRRGQAAVPEAGAATPDFDLQDGELRRHRLLDGAVPRAYDSLRNYGVLRIATRRTFLIDPKGRIARVHRDIVAETQAQTILADLDRLAANIELVTPASGANNQSIPRNS